MVTSAPPIAHGFCRVATVQLDSHAAAWLHGATAVAHPLGDAKAGPAWGLAAAVPAHHRPTLTRLAERVGELYTRQLRGRLEAVLRFVTDLGTQVVVLPEYSVPPALLPHLAELLRELAPDLILVAGTHGVPPDGAHDKAPYASIGYEGGPPEPLTSVAPLLNGDRLVALFPKVALTEQELYGGARVPTDAPAERVFRWASGREIWVAICRDFLETGRASVPEPAAPGRLLIVPALTPAKSLRDEFDPKLLEVVRRAHCPIAFANLASEGGSRVWPLVIHGLGPDDFPPLAAGEEGVVVVDVEIEGHPGTVTAPFPVRAAPRLIAATGFLYAARETDLRHAERVAEGLRIATSPDLVRWLAHASRQADESTEGRRQRWAKLSVAAGFADPAEAHAMMREVVVEAEALPLPILERALAEGVAAALAPLALNSVLVDTFVRGLRIDAAKRPEADAPGRETASRIREALALFSANFSLTADDALALEALSAHHARGDYAAVAAGARPLLERRELGHVAHVTALDALIRALYGTVWELPVGEYGFNPIPLDHRQPLVLLACAGARGLAPVDGPGVGPDDGETARAEIQALRRRLLGVVNDREVVGLSLDDALVIPAPPAGPPWLDGFVTATRDGDLVSLRALHSEFPDAMPVAFLLADRALRAGANDEALCAAHRAFELLPGDGQRRKLAEVLTAQEHWQEAVTLLEAVEDDLGAAGRILLANARAALGDDIEAARVLDAQLRSHPDDLATRLQRQHLVRHTEPFAVEGAWKAFEGADPSAQAAVHPFVYRRLADQLRMTAAQADAAQAELRCRLRSIAEVLSAQSPSFETDTALLMVTSGLDGAEVRGLRRPELERYGNDSRHVILGYGPESLQAFMEGLKADSERVEQLHHAGVLSFEVLGLHQPRVWFERAVAIFDGRARLPAVPGWSAWAEPKPESALRGLLLLGPLEVLLIVQSGLRFEEFAAVLGAPPLFALFEDTLARLHDGARAVLDATYAWRGEPSADAPATLAERVRRWLADGQRAGMITIRTRPVVEVDLPERLNPDVQESLRAGLSRWEAVAKDPELGMLVADAVEIGRASLLSPFVAFRDQVNKRVEFQRLIESFKSAAARVSTLAGLLAEAAGSGRRPKVLERLAGWGVSDVFTEEDAVGALVPTTSAPLPAELLDAHEAACRKRLAWSLPTGRPVVVERVLHYAEFFTSLITAGRESAAAKLLDRLDVPDRDFLLGTLTALELATAEGPRAVIDRWCEGYPARRALVRMAARLRLAAALTLGPAHARVASVELFADTEATVSTAFILDGMYELTVLRVAWPEVGPLPRLGGLDLDAIVSKELAVATADGERWSTRCDLVQITADDEPLWLPSAVVALGAPAGWVAQHAPALAAAARPLDGRLADAFVDLGAAPVDPECRGRLARAAIDSAARLCARSPEALGWLDFVLGRAGAEDTLRELRALLSQPDTAVRPFELRATLVALQSEPRWAVPVECFSLLLRASAIPLSWALFDVTRGWIDQGAEAALDALEALHCPEDLTSAELTRYVFVAGRVAALDPSPTLPSGEEVDLRTRVIDTLVTLLRGATASPAATVTEDPTIAEAEAPLARLAIAQVLSLRRNEQISDAETLYLHGILRRWMRDVLAQADAAPRRAFLEDLVRRNIATPDQSTHVLNPAAWGPGGLDLRTASVLFALTALTMPDPEPPTWLPARADLTEALLALAARPLTRTERRLRSPTPDDVALGVSGPVAVADLALYALARVDPGALRRVAPEVLVRLVDELPYEPAERDAAPWELVLPVVWAITTSDEPLGDEPRTRLAEHVARWLELGLEVPEVALAAAWLADDDATASLALGRLVETPASSDGDVLSPLLLASARIDTTVLGQLSERLVALGVDPLRLVRRLAAIEARRDHVGATAAREVLITVAARHGLHQDPRVDEILRSLHSGPEQAEQERNE